MLRNNSKDLYNKLIFKKICDGMDQLSLEDKEERYIYLKTTKKVVAQ